MAGEHRTTIDTVDQTLTEPTEPTEPTELSELSERIRSFDFVAAVRRLENAHSEKPRVGEAVRIRDDVVRLSQSVSLGFQGTALHSLTATKGAHAHRMHVNFLGLLGSNGPMPLHYTEYADQRARHHADPTFREFLDLFNHRMLSLFYRASVQFDPAVSFDRPGNNTYADILGAVCGILPEAATNRDAIQDSTKRHYPGWFCSTAKSPDGIVAIVGDYFDLPVSVREWVGGWLPLPKSAEARLGQDKQSIQLGRALYIGKRIWSIRHKFHVQLGLLDWNTFSSFKPGGPRANKLYDLIRNYVGDEWDWDLELKLKGSEVRPLRLDRQSTLGFDSWMRSTGGKRMNNQSIYLNRKLISQCSDRQGIPS